MASAVANACEVCHVHISLEVHRIYKKKCEPCWRSRVIIERCKQCDRMLSSSMSGICTRCEEENSKPKWRASPYKKCKTCFCATKRREMYEGNCKKCYEPKNNA